MGVVPVHEVTTLDDLIIDTKRTPGDGGCYAADHSPPRSGRWIVL